MLASSSTMRSFANFHYTGYMPFTKVACMRDLAEGAMLEVTAGDNYYALCNVEGEVHVVESGPSTPPRRKKPCAVST